MRKLFFALLLCFSCFLTSAQEVAFQDKLTHAQKFEFATLTEKCKLTAIKYTDEKGKTYPVYYDPATKTTFYVYVYKRHVKTVDIDRRIVMAVD